MPDFEDDARRQEARIRKDQDVSDVNATGYRNTDGTVSPTIGNEDGPYVNALGRASTDPLAADPGVPAVTTGKGQRILTDEYGRVAVIVTAPITPPTVRTISLIPTGGAPQEAVLSPASALDLLLYEALATDYRAVPVASPRYLMIFDSAATPNLADVPVLPAIEIVSFAGLSEVDFAGPITFTLGIWIAISSTPLDYTPITDDDFSLMLRSGAA